MGSPTIPLMHKRTADAPIFKMPGLTLFISFIKSEVFSLTPLFVRIFKVARHKKVTWCSKQEETLQYWVAVVALHSKVSMSSEYTPLQHRNRLAAGIKVLPVGRQHSCTAILNLLQDSFPKVAFRAGIHPRAGLILQEKWKWHSSMEKTYHRFCPAWRINTIHNKILYLSL